MAKLSPEQVGSVNAAEAAGGGGFLLEPGRYAAQLAKVEQRSGTNFPFWNWEFANLFDKTGALQPGKQWNNTSLSPNSFGFLKASFEAFGASPDTDTDELVGKWVVLSLDQEQVTQGPKVGELRNVVKGLAQFREEDWPFDSSSVGNRKGVVEDDEF